jgi:transcriptional regulator with XRE-family HTH domain
MEQKSRNFVGSKIRQLRNAKNWTQEVLAARCGVVGYDLARGTLAKIEAEIRGISDVELFVIARVLGVNIADLFPVHFANQLKRGGARVK